MVVWSDELVLLVYLCFLRKYYKCMKEFVLSFIKREDHWAIMVGAFILIMMSIISFQSIDKLEVKYDQLDNQYAEVKESGSDKLIEEFDYDKRKKEIKVQKSSLAVALSDVVKTPKVWEKNPLGAIYDAEKKINIIPSLIILMIIMMLVFGVVAKGMGVSFSKFCIGFIGLFLIALIAYIFASQISSKQFGLNYAIWAIALGILISNTIGTPRWIKPALMGELFIKVGLILLGAEILFSKVLVIGLPGIFVAWVVTPIVLIVTYIFGQKVLKISSKSLNMTICADMSVCGVSAAIATAMACKAKKEELTLALSLSMIFTAIMMVLMPIGIKALGLSEVLGGAVLGGTLDATGAVVAAGAFLGEKALSVAATIKMIQNILIGFIAFGVAVYWTTKVDRTSDVKPKVSEIFSRFPRFLLGFIGASVIFSLIHSSMGNDMGNQIIEQGVIKGFTKSFKGWLFCLAFVSIGLNTNFKELSSQFKSGKHITLYIVGQCFNILLTFGMAYLMFEVIFPEVADKI